MTTRTLILVRHAKAQGWSSKGDRARHLSEAGIDQARRLGRSVARVHPVVDAAAVSSATRAIETYIAIAETVEVASSWEDDEAYMAGPDTFIEIARALDNDVTAAMIVGHEPTVSMTSAILAGTDEGRDAVGMGVPTATAVILTFDGDWADLEEQSCDVALIHESHH